MSWTALTDPLWHSCLFLPTAPQSFKPSFSPLPVYHPYQSASCAPVAGLQTFPAFPDASLPAPVHHRNDNTEDVPSPKHIQPDYGSMAACDIPSRYVSATHFTCTVLILAL